MRRELLGGPTHRVTFSIGKPQLEQLDRFCWANQMTLSAVVRRAIDALLRGDIRLTPVTD